VKNRSVNTVRGYISDLKLLQAHCRVTDWSGFTEDMAVDYVRHLKRNGRDTSIARKVYCFRGFFKFLSRQGCVARDPFGDMEFNRLRRPLPKFLTVDEMNTLLNRVREPLPALMGVPQTGRYLTARDRAMLETLYNSALRVSELVGLNWGDIDFNAREVRVLGKGNKERICPLGQRALEALLEYAKHYEARFEKKAEGSQPLFISQWGRRIVQRSIPRTIRKWCALAGIKKRVNPHAFRHSATTHMLENGADLRVIQKLLGHASIATTEIYTHVGTRRLKAVHANTHPRA
jgi:site-specific recombinase XerD